MPGTLTDNENTKIAKPALKEVYKLIGEKRQKNH
jgi:hypothetical protein